MISREALLRNLLRLGPLLLLLAAGAAIFVQAGLGVVRAPPLARVPHGGASLHDGPPLDEPEGGGRSFLKLQPTTWKQP